MIVPKIIGTIIDATINIDMIIVIIFMPLTFIFIIFWN